MQEWFRCVSLNIENMDLLWIFEKYEDVMTKLTLKYTMLLRDSNQTGMLQLSLGIRIFSFSVILVQKIWNSWSEAWEITKTITSHMGAPALKNTKYKYVCAF